MKVRKGRAAARIGVVVAAWMGLVGAASAADMAKMRENARRDATAMYDAFVSGDFATFVRYTSPKIVEKAGGSAALVAVVKKGATEMERAGSAPKSATIQPPTQVVAAGDEFHAILPMALVLSAPGGELRVASHLLGVSADKGATWTFIDPTPLTDETVKEVLPNYNPALKLPAKTEPTFVPK